MGLKDRLEFQEKSKPEYTEIVFILDRSGSMSGLEADTIGGFNTMLEKQKKEPGEAVISTILFHSESQVIHNRQSLEEVLPMTDKDYIPMGSTALLDALGDAITHISQIHKEMKKKYKPKKTLFVIITDGEENSSRKYSYAQIKEMIQKKKEKKNWEFLFLGANMDAIAAADRIGIHEDRATTFLCDEEGTALNYEEVTAVLSQVRDGTVPLGRKWKNRIEQDVAKRGGFV
ncbi:MAG: VWA domain-containing protein [Lachnospiraceae bacterium]|nr:VWA domain-containing protein [Lachnospiraceae bacterium]